MEAICTNIKLSVASGIGYIGLGKGKSIWRVCYLLKQVYLCI